MQSLEQFPYIFLDFYGVYYAIFMEMISNVSLSLSVPTYDIKRFLEDLLRVNIVVRDKQEAETLYKMRSVLEQLVPEIDTYNDEMHLQ